MSKHRLLKGFFNKFVNEQFFYDLFRLILYPSDFGIINKKSTAFYIEQFLDDIQKAAQKYNIIITKQEEINLAKTLLNIKQSYELILSYKTVFQHITPKSPYLKTLLDKVTKNPISNPTEFKQLKENILSKIQAFYEINSITRTIISFDSLVQTIEDDNIEIFEAIKLFREYILNGYSSLSNLQQIIKQDTINDYFILTDDESLENLSDTLVSYIFDHYSNFYTGYKFIDNTLDGLESSSVHVISAPSNHGKSLFMVNLAANIIKNNLQDYKENDVIVFLTLEDDIYKLFRRFVSVFGNYDADVVRKVFKLGATLSKDSSLPQSTKNTFKKILINIIKSSIFKITNNQVGIVIKHSEENTFSPMDLSKFIDQLKLNNYNVKAVFADYIDVFVPTINRYSQYKDYDAQGTVVQELRSLARQYKIPVITATQNRRGSENPKLELTNEDIGDSYKKVRFADYLYMARQRKDLDIFSPLITKPSTTDDSAVSKYKSYQDILQRDLIPLELKITKAKEGERDQSTFLLFSRTNLRIYNSIDEYLSEYKVLLHNSKTLKADLDRLENLTKFRIHPTPEANLAALNDN